jgi:hypothetical protein
MSCLIRNEQDLEISRRDDNRSLTLSEAVDWISIISWVLVMASADGGVQGRYNLQARPPIN